MNRLNTIVFAFIVTLTITQTNALHIKTIRNELDHPITIIYYHNGQAQRTIYMPELCIHVINFELQESSQPITDRLDQADHYIEICTSSNTKFFCAEGNRHQIINGNEYRRHATWIQKVSFQKEALFGNINLLCYSYGLAKSLNTSQDSIKKSQTHKAASFTLHINAEDRIEAC